MGHLLRPGTVLVYGEAGAGKTVLAVEALKHRCRLGTCVYVSSEGTDFIKRLENVQAPFANILVKEVIDTYDLVDSTIEVEQLIDQGHTLRLIVVDSINATLRREAWSDDIARALAYVAASLHTVANVGGIPVILTGQVHAVDEGIEAVGLSIIAPWLDRVVRLEREAEGVRRLVVEDYGFVCRFRIEDRGITWLS
jgi:predicted ATP-dependent serine protease